MMKTSKPLLLLAVAMFFAMAANAQFKAGDKAVDFSLPGIDGKNVSLADYNDVKGIILVFTCNTCPVAIKYEDRIVALHNKFAAKGYPVVAINPNDLAQKPDDSLEAMKKRAKDKGFSFAYLRDDSQEITKIYGAQRTPEVYVLQKKGSEFVVAYSGAIDNNADDASSATKFYVQEAIASLLNSGKPELTETRAVGCSIKWKASVN
jgi:peroxiredoxin